MNTRDINIKDRNEALHAAQNQLQALVTKLTIELNQMNYKIIEANQARELTQTQMFELLTDRLSEVAFPGRRVHRY